MLHTHVIYLGHSVRAQNICTLSFLIYPTLFLTGDEKWDVIIVCKTSRRTFCMTNDCTTTTTTTALTIVICYLFIVVSFIQTMPKAHRLSIAKVKTANFEQNCPSSPVIMKLFWKLPYEINRSKLHSVFRKTNYLWLVYFESKSRNSGPRCFKRCFSCTVVYSLR